MADNALGKGLDALIQEPETTKKTTAKKTKKSTTKSSRKNKSSTAKSSRKTTNNIDIDQERIDQIKQEVEKNPRISLWSSKSAATLRYLKKTIPEFSISNEASIILEDAIKEKYPDIWALFDDE
ncbi:MAG: hypothetical protein LUG89_02155 [Methanosphaera sp.]|nr:hypothetical protein [Methanosphaera sp.]